MKLSMTLLASAFVLADAVVAAEPDMRSPYDTNPRCAERTTSASDPACEIQTEGTPRQTYPPKSPPSVVPPPKEKPAPPPPPVMREGGKSGAGAGK